MSICPVCKGIVRAVVEEKLKDKIKKNFYKEVLDYDLNIKTVPLDEYRKNIPEWCECNV